VKEYWMSWVKAAGIRAVRTFAEAALAYIGTSATVLGDVNWIGVLSAGAFGAVTAMLLALKGLPEVEVNGSPLPALKRGRLHVGSVTQIEDLDASSGLPEVEE